jgi:hypothetical protein
MHSGGDQKLEWAHIYIEAPEEEAKSVFYARFGRNPERVTCTCCGDDYDIEEFETLEEATAYQRGCDYVYFDPEGEEVPEDEAWVIGEGVKEGYSSGWVEHPDTGGMSNKYSTLEKYLSRKGIYVIFADEIASDERRKSVPEEGFVWVGD